MSGSRGSFAFGNILIGLVIGTMASVYSMPAPVETVKELIRYVPKEVVIYRVPLPDYTEEDLYYMTEALYFESGVDPLVGQVAVGRTILNRVKSWRWPNSVREVVHQKRRGIGQFSYFTDNKPESIPQHKFDELYPIAKYILDTEDGVDITDGSDHYYNPDIVVGEPDWAKRMVVTGKFGSHIHLRDVL